MRQKIPEPPQEQDADNDDDESEYNSENQKVLGINENTSHIVIAPF